MSEKNYKYNIQLKTNLIILSILFLSISCNWNDGKSDAYGNFEVDETHISTEISGKLLQMNVEEGQNVQKGDKMALVDTTQLSLRKQQLMAQRNAVATKVDNILSQIAVQREQRKTLITEKQRLEKLLSDGAATVKQMDDVNGRISVIDKQIESIESQNAAVLSEIKAFDLQIEQANDQLSRSYIINPFDGIVLETYTQQSELVMTGKILYKIADITNMFLRVYISGAQLSQVELGQKVTVLIDKSKDETESLTGEVVWISSQAEFTPKIIQTKEERVNLVYAMKIKVANDGKLKIGMPGEVLFSTSEK